MLENTLAECLDFGKIYLRRWWKFPTKQPKQFYVIQLLLNVHLFDNNAIYDILLWLNSPIWLEHLMGPTTYCIKSINNFTNIYNFVLTSILT